MTALAALLALAGIGQAPPAASAPPPGDLPAQVFADIPGSEVEHIVLFSEGRPTILRYRIRIREMGHRLAWDEFVLRLHRYLDTDGNGVTTAAEAEKRNIPFVLNSPFNGGRSNVRSARPNVVLDPDKDGVVSVAELGEYLRTTQGHGAFGVAPGQPPDENTQVLFGHLDADGDKALSAAELADTARLLLKLDLDDDEVVTLGEMRPYRSAYADQFFARPNPRNGKPEEALVLALDSPEARKQAAARLIAKYETAVDGKKLGKLAPADLGMAPAELGKADTDGDGRLDAKELAAYLEHPAADLECRQGLAEPANPNGGKVELAKLAERPSTVGDRQRKSNDGAPEIDIGLLRVEFAAGPVFGDNEEFVKMQFKAADGDSNGYLEKKEADQNGFINQFFAAADRDGDGKLYEAELVALLERQGDAIRSRAILSISDQGHALFRLLDRDNDRRLSRREIRDAAARLREFDRDGDGKVALAEIPRDYQLSVGSGQSFGRGINFEFYQNGVNPPNKLATTAPAWFRRMDRNRDGDVSLREFLGPIGAFRELDTDGDELISIAEAEAK